MGLRQLLSSGPGRPDGVTAADTGRALAVGAAGAGLAWLLALPAAVLVGPALLVSLAGLRGWRLGLPAALRDLCFVVLGVAIGAGIDARAGAAFLRWPLAHAVMLPMLAATLWAGRAVLERGFGFDRRSAVLASAPGHLSLALSLAAETGCDVARVAVVQGIRLLMLTVSVPFVAGAMGYPMQGALLPAGAPAGAGTLAALLVAGAGAGLIMRRLGLPAPLLLGPLLISGLAHATGLAAGAPPGWLMVPAFLVLGTLIGTRFAGMPAARFRASLAAGLSVTAVAVAMTLLAAIPVAAMLGMPAAHVMAAFAPGGLETMVALGAAMGASPGFVIASHAVRLAILAVLLPLSLARAAPSR